MKRNIFLSVAAIGMSAVLLSACSTTNSTETSSSQAAQAESQQDTAASRQGEDQLDATSSATQTNGSETSEAQVSGEDHPGSLSDGRVLIAYFTHDGSGMGSSVQDIKALCPDATVLDGLAVRYTDVQNAKDKVENWIHEMEQE